MRKWLSFLVTCTTLASVALVVGSSAPTPAYAQSERTFPETGKTVKGRFLEYWSQNGGLAQQGYPISEETQEVDKDGKVRTVQYFQRAVFEYHDEYEGTANDVLLSLLGVFYYNEKYKGNAPNQKASAINSHKFSETGKTIGGVFRKYWETHGGLAQQGFPISDEFQEKDKDGKTRTVQYFQRAVFEYHEEFAGTSSEVLLSLLGVFYYDKKHTGGGGGARPPAIPAGPLTIVALGDSLTEGDGDYPGEGGGYPARLQMSISEIRPGSQVINLGKSGWDSQQMVEGQLPTALEANPNIALVWIGSNNLWYNNGPEGEASDLAIYRGHIDTTLRSLAGKGARIFIALLDDQTKRPYSIANYEPDQLAHMSHLVTAFNDVIRAEAAEYGATTVDFYNTTIFTDPSTLSEDGIHANPSGHDQVAQKWLDAIRQAMQ
jgi:lysophospholipase L1-like esterase